MIKKRVFSGIQPTGELHIGNYLGAIKQWIEMQKKYDCIFCIVDLHAITSPFNPRKLKNLIIEKAAIYIAAGVDPKKSIIFVQSHVKEHTELAWLLNAITPLGDLNRMTQYKEKSKKFNKNLNAGLLNYPILMASDILLYQTSIVPVGKDQQQHVELTRTIAKKFNQTFNEMFVIPKSQLPQKGAKIMSLTNPTKKMSKSDKTETRINIFDKPEIIRKKIMAAVTDTEKEIKYDVENKPGISNLLTIYSLFSDKSINLLEKDFQNKNYKEFKESLADLLIKSLTPFRERKKELFKEKYLQKILDDGAKRAQKIALQTIKKTKKEMGLI